MYKNLIKIPWYIIQGKHFPEMSWEQRAKAYNGIGPAWFTPWIRDRLDHLLSVFLFAVLIHDCDYQLGVSLWEKIKADFRLFINCLLSIVFELYAEDFSKTMRFTVYAVIMYILVVLFGGFAYFTDEKKKPKFRDTILKKE